MRDEVPAWPPGRLALDDERAEALGRAVDRGGEPGRGRRRSRPRRSRPLGLGAEPEQLGDAAQLRADDRLAADEPNHRAVALVRQRSVPLPGRVGVRPAAATGS